MPCNAVTLFHFAAREAGECSIHSMAPPHAQLKSIVKEEGKMSNDEGRGSTGIFHK